MKKTLKEQMLKVYESNEKIKEVLDEKSFSAFVETFDGEFAKIVKRNVNEEKKKLSAEYSKYNKSMQLTYEKNLAKAIDTIVEDLVKMTSKNTINEYVGLIDKYFANTINENVNQIKNEIRKEAKIAIAKKVKTMKEFVKQNKYGMVIEQLQNVMKSLALVEDVNLVKDLKVMASKYNQVVKANKSQKRKYAKIEMNAIFNENFGQYSAIQKNNIKNILRNKKFKSMKEFKREVSIIKTGLKEGVYDINSTKSFKKNVSERNNKRSNLKETFINNRVDDYEISSNENERYLEKYYSQLNKK